ncbi:MAG TPA: arylesterase [Candidatus Limnocylindrales bacterium]|nr:arylesterase [Candidatus Limnocylindrales bacterium]
MMRRLAAALLTATLSAPPALALEAPPQTGTGKPLVVCLGDSLTEGYGLPPEQAYPALVEKELRASGYPHIEVVNAGVSGSTSASAVARLKWQLRRKPDILLLALGANDGLRGIDLSQTKKNLAEAIDLAKDNGVVVLLAGMLLPPNYGRDYTQTFQKMYTDLAREKNVALLPFLLEGVAADSTKNLPDGVHPNASGYEIVARNVTRHLRPLLEGLDASSKLGPGLPLEHFATHRRKKLECEA